MKWSMIILILTIQNFFQEQFDLVVEFLDNPLKISRAQQMFKFSQNSLVFTRVKFTLLTVFQNLNLEEKMQEISVCRSGIEINGQNGLKRLIAFSIFAHGSIMNRVSTILVLLSQNLSAPFNDILGVLLE
jgi:hypothetical protein